MTMTMDAHQDPEFQEQLPSNDHDGVLPSDLEDIEDFADVGGDMMVTTMTANAGGGDGLMHDGVDTHQEEGRRRLLCRHQRLFCQALGILCVAVVVLIVAIGAASGQINEDDIDDTDPLEYGIESTISDLPPPPVINDGNNVPATAPVHSSFDQPSIAGNDPVGDAPSVTAAGGDNTPQQASLPAFTRESLGDPNSAQSQAWAWLSDHPDFETMEDYRVEQLLAMASFYYSYAGDNWSAPKKKNWLSYEFNECLWGSFAMNENECTGKYRMKILRLQGQDQSVKGSTPLELTLLTALERLEIFEMKLGTTLDKVLPSGLSEMTALDRVRFSDSQLSGTMPPYLGDFTLLTSLNVRSNHLDGEIPTELGLLTNLKYLTLYGNKFEGTVPTELVELTNLVALSLQDNDLTGSLPAAFCALRTLRKLEVDCQKTSCPMACDCTCKDPKLIRGTATPTTAPLPTSLTPFPTMAPRDGILLGMQQHSLDALQQFNSPQFRGYAWLLNHPILDKLPEWRKEQLFGLVTFYYAFSGVWTSSERNLWLDYETHECDWGIGLCDFDNRFLKVTLEDAENVKVNMVGNTIPRELGMLSILEDIELYGLGLEANMAAVLPLLELQYLPLITINLQGNLLYGSIPSELANLRRLRNLSLARNALDSSIPTELGLLQDLKHLTLHENIGLIGQLPSELGQLSQLETLWIDRTGIVGSVPKQICNLPSLQTLRVNCAKVPCPNNCDACQCVHPDKSV